jgi:hypothetical protein
MGYRLRIESEFLIMSTEPTPTPITYRFSTFQELVDRVPAESIRDCMEELGASFEVAKGTAELATDVAYALAERDGKPRPPWPDSVITLPNEFEWLDDGKRDIKVDLETSPGTHLVTVELVKEKQCDHNAMVANGDPKHVWKCSRCGCVYGSTQENKE